MCLSLSGALGWRFDPSQSLETIGELCCIQLEFGRRVRGGVDVKSGDDEAEPAFAALIGTGQGAKGRSFRDARILAVESLAFVARCATSVSAGNLDDGYRLLALLVMVLVEARRSRQVACGATESGGDRVLCPKHESQGKCGLDDEDAHVRHLIAERADHRRVRIRVFRSCKETRRRKHSGCGGSVEALTLEAVSVEGSAAQAAKCSKCDEYLAEHVCTNQTGCKINDPALLQCKSGDADQCKDGLGEHEGGQWKRGGVGVNRGLEGAHANDGNAECRQSNCHQWRTHGLGSWGSITHSRKGRRGRLFRVRVGVVGSRCEQRTVGKVRDGEAAVLAPRLCSTMCHGCFVDLALEADTRSAGRHLCWKLTILGAALARRNG